MLKSLLSVYLYLLPNFVVTFLGKEFNVDVEVKKSKMLANSNINILF